MTFRSIVTIGADKALESHQADGNGIVWAIIDTGLDGSHDHFKKHANLDLPPPLRHRAFSTADHPIELDDDESEEEALVDVHGHGTHLAGIVAGELSATKSVAVKDLGVKAMRGIAPRAKLISVKVFSDKERSFGTEKALLEAVKWILKINKGREPRVHGVLIGLSFPSDVRNFACGHTPVCEAVNDLVDAGLVVVAAAGNLGYRDSGNEGAWMQQAIYGSITDPGNAELAITVGATHRRFPAQYGASFFSSKGPTSDGRYKPDLLAPGERITSCAPGRENVGKTSFSTYRELDGTSVAAAHVAGAAAALMSVRRTLIGQPNDVKRILLQAATDLNRIPEAQGAGVLNLAKALSQKFSRSTRLEKKQEEKAELPPLARGKPRGAPRLPEHLPVDRPTSTKPFVIAFSYPGKHVDRVRKTVGEVRRRALLEPKQLFYAPYHRALLAQPNLDKVLPPIYFEESELVVVFLGDAYQESDWCGLEWRAILKRVRTEGGQRVMLLRLDDGEVKGLKRTDGYIDVQVWLPEEVADLILERLELVRNP